MDELVYRDVFCRALRLLSQVCQSLAARNLEGSRPVLVGGAVVEFDTGGRFMSGDFDFVTAHDDAFYLALQEAGFVQDLRHGRLQRPSGWVHPELLIGVEIVSGALFDGRTDLQRIRLIETGTGEICMPPTEDMIADRLGQWEASGRLDRDMLEQALAMWQLADGLDPDYLELRIRTETANAFGMAVLLTLSEGEGDGEADAQGS